MLQDNITRLTGASFDALLARAVDIITENGFLLIGEIDPQAILMKHGIETGKVRQLLFFHPVYMQQILAKEPAAVIEAPLKLVLRELACGGTAVSYFDPVAHFAGYDLLEDLANELRHKQESILAQLLP